MPIPIIVATPGAANANSFGTLAEANAYHETQYHSSNPWSASEISIQTPALIMAAQQITALIEWTGYVADTIQVLPWPRTGMWRRNGISSIPSTEIPVEVKQAQFELARLLIASDLTANTDTSNISSLKAGPIAITFQGASTDTGVIPDSVTNLLVPSWLVSVTGQASGTRDLLRY